VTDDKFLLLKMHPVSRGLADRVIREIADAAELVRCEPGEHVLRANEVLTSVYLVMHGRLKQSLVDSRGNVLITRFQTAGGLFGGLAAALAEPVPVDCVAEDRTTLLRLDYTTALELTKQHNDFRLNMSRLMAQVVQQVLLQERKREGPRLVAFCHQSNDSRVLTRKLIGRLMELGEHPCVLTDQSEWEPMDGVPHRCIFEGGRRITEEETRHQVSQWSDSSRILFDVGHAIDSASMPNLVEVVDGVFWCVTPKTWHASTQRLKAITERGDGWREKICLVWLLEGNQQAAPVAPELTKLAKHNVKLSFSEPIERQGSALQDGFERLIHQLRGLKIGVALGGGAARGMAHLGVLKALAKSGIIVDMIAGTSSGAMTGTLYASGMDADYAIESFVTDLRPGWFFRHIPRGDQWYLLYKYRRGQFDPMLRRYLKDKLLEQLPIPMHSITVDLISGKTVVREEGDAVQAILESINLPVLNIPINREGQALVDGGLVNNVPADVLVSKGCNFVIAVSVTAKMEHEFAQNRPDTPTAKMKSASTLQTVLRSYLVQSVNLNSIGVNPADIVIEPDVTAFELTEFSRTDELAAVGEQATVEAIPRIKELLGPV
jgi:predicted acylesterase/phospholipase RssA/CRP-like cAMP-binding protein